MKVYQKPKPVQEQASQQTNLKTRIWPGQVLKQQDDSDDDIFDVPKKSVQKPQDVNQKQEQSQQVEQFEEIEQFQEIEQQDFQIEAIDEEEMKNKRRLIQSRVEEEELRQEQQIEQRDISKQEKKKKKKKSKKEKQVQEVKQNEENEQEDEEQQNIMESMNKTYLQKPVFVPKQQRDKEDFSYEEEIRLKEEKERNLERMRIENKVLILNSQRADVKVNEDSDDGFQIPNDEDTLDEKEYTFWKIRELKRIKQYNEDKSYFDREKAEIERRRDLTDQQRIEEDFKLGSDKTKLQDKAKLAFMQKYYHKGAYFQDSNDPIFQRDYNLPVGFDLQDKSKLPKILQKRRGEFGKKGQSKYTHLTDVDTTDFNPEYQMDQNIRQKFIMKQAGNKTTNIFNQNKR